MLAAARPAAGTPCRTLEYAFTTDCLRAPEQTGCEWNPAKPDLGPQIAVWVESADRTRFVDTLMVTNATALFGIGNRPGQWDLRSGPKFPYGRRPMALPVWAHSRGVSYPLVVMQDGDEGMLTFHEGDSSPEPHFCRPMLPSEEVDAVTCPSGLFRSDKGRLDSTQISFYPPRADLLDFGLVCPYLPNRPSGSCNPGDSAQYPFLNDIDVVAAATPAFGAPSGGAWIIPDALPPGDYALMVEVGKEFDTNANYAAPNAPSLDFDVFGTAGNLGQPSVVYRVPFTLDAGAASFTAAATGLFGYGDWTGQTAAIFPPDGSIGSSPGSGEGRLATSDGAGGAGRVHLAISACGLVDCSSEQPPLPVPIEVVAGEVTPRSAVIRIRQVADGQGPVLRYDVRSTLEDQDAPEPAPETIPAADFARWVPAASVAPAAPGTTTDAEIADLEPDSTYAVGIVAQGRCGASPVTFARFHTPAAHYQRLHGCFIATAAFGSPMANELGALRRLRDRAESASAVALVATDLYYRAAPAVSEPLSRSDAARALVRRALRPITTLAVPLAAEVTTGGRRPPVR